MNKVFDESNPTGLVCWLKKDVFYFKFFFSVSCSFPKYLVLNFIFIPVLYLEFVFTSVRKKAA